MPAPVHARDVAFTRHGARRGLDWLRSAFDMLSRHRIRWILIVVVYYALMQIGGTLGIFQLLLPLLKPVFAVGFLAAAWSQERGDVPLLRHLFQGFRANLAALMLLGLFFLLGISAAVLATPVVDGGTLVEILQGRAELTVEILKSGLLQKAMLFAAVCALPTILALWFAPGLVVFQNIGAFAALAASLRAALANWRPLLVYAMGFVVFGMLVPGAVASIIMLLLPAPAGNTIVLMLALPYLFLFIATVHISDYVSYRDVFHAGESLTKAGQA